MNDRNQKWSKRLSWAKCEEPYKNQLDAVASLWVEGAMSNHELAFETVRLLSEIDQTRQLADGAPRPHLDVVVSQVKILSEAMLTASLYPSTTEEDRRSALEFQRNIHADEGRGR